ncbi:toprim domain-containing protein [Emticicia sp. 17c]|uniref:toprim domain-containing protein n=1 Tax=Emticicia sp. 17c TaxID=3127704 RepID=UPI00301E39C3
MSKTIEEINQAKAVPLTSIMQSIGHELQHQSGNELLYYSPFRDERTPSFSIDVNKNLWSDFGNSKKYEKGDSPIGFVMLYHKLTFPAAVEWLLRFDGCVKTATYMVTHEKEQALKVLAIKQITNPKLIQYAESRSISYTVLSKYCKEVIYKHTASNRIYTAIGFKNNADGYELRFKGKDNGKDFKACLGKKDITFIDNFQSDLLVFEGFFDFLSFIELDVYNFQANYLILNSIALLNRFDFTPVNAIYSYLDNDKGGRNTYDKIKQLHQPKHIINASAWNFPNHKDLNEYLVCQNAKRQTELS